MNELLAGPVREPEVPVSVKVPFWAIWQPEKAATPDAAGTGLFEHVTGPAGVVTLTVTGAVLPVTVFP